MVTIPSHGWFVTLYPRFSPSNHGFSNDWIGFTTKVSDFPWANPLIHRFSWFPESTSWMIFGCSEFQIELALHCRFHGCYGHGREEEEGGRSPVQPSRPLCWRSHLQVPRSRDWRSDVCVHGTIWSIVVNLEVGKSWRKIWLSAMSRCSFNVCCLAQLGWAEKLSMAWNDCMCVIDTNVWIKFGGVSGLKLHQVMAWKHRCSWQKVGALFSELWESDCCSGEELPDWRHQASSVFWCDARALHSLPYSSIDVQPLVEPLRCQPHLTAFVSKFSPLLMAEGFVNLLGCVCGRGDIEVTNTGRSKIAFQIRDGDGVSFGGLAIGAAANEIAEYPEMAVVNLFGGNLTQAGSREESGMGGWKSKWASEVWNSLDRCGIRKWQR